jgi:hypothetical protein
MWRVGRMLPDRHIVSHAGNKRPETANPISALRSPQNIVRQWVTALRSPSIRDGVRRLASALRLHSFVLAAFKGP